MLINGSRLINCPILSLHLGGETARVAEVIVNPNNLAIVVFRAEGPLLDNDTGDILPIDSVREFSRLGMIIDSIDEFVDGEEVIRIKDILKLNFKLPGLKVVSENKTKIGKVIDYTVDVSSWSIHQIIVQRPLIKSFLDPELIISRNEIIEIDDYKITIKDEHSKAKTNLKASTTKDFVPNFINPFREPDFTSPSQSKTSS